MRPDSTVGGFATAIVALLVAAALATAFFALAREPEDEPSPPAVVTIES